MYALQYTGQKDLKQQDLKPAGTAVDRLPEQVKKARFFFRSAKDFERLREEEYQDMLKGKGRGPLLSPGRLP